MRALLSFFTALPLRDSSLEAAAKRVYLLPLVGLFTGTPGVGVVLLGYAVPPGVVATLALATVLLAAGLHHTDGVLDVGDALMVRGTQERRRAVLKDARAGTGGIGALFVVYAPTLAALAALVDDSPVRAAFALLAGEVAVRSAMVLILAFGEPAVPGSSAVPFIRSLAGRRRSLAVSLAVIGPLLCLLPLGGLAPAAAGTVPIAAIATLQVARRTFGGIGGDAVGAAGEMTRAALLVVLSATL